MRDASSEKQPPTAATRAVRVAALTADHHYRFPAATTDDTHTLDAELLANRDALGNALAAAAAPSLLVQHPSTTPQHSVLAYAAANLPITSAIDPLRLGQQLLVPAPRPSSRKQVSYLFFALDHMLKHVGRHAAAAAAAAAAGTAATAAAASTQAAVPPVPHTNITVPSLMADLPSYAGWCGLSGPATSGGPAQLVSPVADLAIGSFTHTPAPPPAPPQYEAQRSGAAALPACRDGQPGQPHPANAGDPPRPAVPP